MEIPRDIKLIIFDFDGTLYDMKIDWTLAKKLAEVRENEYLGEAIERHKREGNDKPLKQLDNLEANALRDSTLSSEIVEALCKFSKKYHLAVLSRNSSKVISDFLNRSHIGFDMIVGREAVSRLKPHLEGLDLILKHFNCSPKEAIMVGDSWHDVFISKKIGMKSVIVGDHYQSQGKLRPDYYCKSVPEIDTLLSQ